MGFLNIIRCPRGVFSSDAKKHIEDGMACFVEHRFLGQRVHPNRQRLWGIKQEGFEWQTSFGKTALSVHTALCSFAASLLVRDNTDTIVTHECLLLLQR